MTESFVDFALSVFIGASWVLIVIILSANIAKLHDRVTRIENHLHDKFGERP